MTLRNTDSVYPARFTFISLLSWIFLLNNVSGNHVFLKLVLIINERVVSSFILYVNTSYIMGHCRTKTKYFKNCINTAFAITVKCQKCYNCRHGRHMLSRVQWKDKSIPGKSKSANVSSSLIPVCNLAIQRPTIELITTLEQIFAWKSTTQLQVEVVKL